MSRILAIANIKGGVGKTTTTANLSAALAARGRRVLAVDLDPQASLTTALGIHPEGLNRTIRDALDGSAKPLDALVVSTREGFDIVPSNHGLHAIEREPENGRARPFALRDAIEPSRGRYEYILLDCPANAGILTGNALAAAGEVLIPFPPDFLALRTVDWLIRLVDELRERLNPSLHIAGFLLAMYSPGTRHTRETIKAARERYGTDIPFFSAAIPLDDRLREAPCRGETVLRYAPESKPAAAYRSLAREIEEGIKEPEPVDAAGAIRRAREAIANGDTSFAYSNYTRATDLNSGLAEAWAGRARTAPDEIESLRSWARALSIDPESAETRAELTSRLTARVAGSSASDVGTLVTLAYYMLEVRQHLYAELILRRVTELEPGHVGAWVARSQAAPEPGMALEFARRAQSLAPDDAIARDQLESALDRVRKTSEALSREAAQSVGSGRREQAHALYRRAADLNPENDRAWVGLARTSDDQSKALEYAQTALRVNPDNSEARNLYHWLYAPERQVIPFPVPLRTILSILIAILLLVAATWILWQNLAS